MSDILTGTPPSLTYLHSAVQDAWAVVWVIVASGLGVLLAWAGISIIFREHLGSQSGWRELVPRLMLGVVAASTSLWWGSFVIDLADSISRFVAASLGVTINDLLRAPLDVLLNATVLGNVGMAASLSVLYLIYGLFVLYVVVQLIIRLALIDLLLVLAPAALGLWILPATAGWGRHWLRMFLVTVFQQSVQLIAMALAFAFLEDYASISAGQPLNDFLWKFLISIAFVYLTTRVPSMLGSTGTFDSWLRTITYAAFMVSRVAAFATGAGAGAAALASAGGAGAAASAGGVAKAGAVSGTTSWISPVAGVVGGGMSSGDTPALSGRGQLALPAGNSTPALPPRSMNE